MSLLVNGPGFEYCVLTELPMSAGRQQWPDELSVEGISTTLDTSSLPELFCFGVKDSLDLSQLNLEAPCKEVGSRRSTLKVLEGHRLAFRYPQTPMLR